MRLLTPVRLGRHEARNRLLFGPHVTNLGRGRAICDRHVAYYRRRAAGGCAVVVTETASVHEWDWPYERAPLATRCAAGWAGVAAAVHAEGALALASLGHAGLQGSSAYSQAPLWAPSRFPDPVTREVPQEMEPAEIDEVLAGFAAAARAAAGAGLDGVEVEAGQHSLVRQFLSGLSNSRADAYGADRTLFLREVLERVRTALPAGAVVGLRLSCDESAPWAGITPQAAGGLAAAAVGWVDYVVAVRAGPFDAAGTTPDGHTPGGFAVPLARALRASLPPEVLVVAQGSLVVPELAEEVLAAGDADLVEMTRAQIAEPELANVLAAGAPEQARPCLLCNQACRVRDARNPLVSCVVEPSAGYETVDPPLTGREARPRDVLVVGAGPAGLEAARVAAARGHRVRVREAAERTGGAAVLAAALPGAQRLAELTRWQEAQCRRLGVRLETGAPVSAADVAAQLAAGGQVVLATGARPPARLGGARSARELAWLAGAGRLAELPAGPAVVDDPIGGPVGVGVAELLAAAGHQVTLVTPDPVAGTLLSLRGDLAPANTRLARAGVAVARRSLLREVGSDAVTLEDRYTGARRTVPARLVVDAGHELAEDTLAEEFPELACIGDALAPRTLLEAVREGRRAALALGAAG